MLTQNTHLAGEVGCTAVIGPGSSIPWASAISLQVGHSGNRPGSRPGTQIFPHRALTAVPVTIPSTTDGPTGTKSPSSGL